MMGIRVRFSEDESGASHVKYRQRPVVVGKSKETCIFVSCNPKKIKKELPISEAPNAEIGPLLPEIIKTGWYVAGEGIGMWVKETMSSSVGFNCLASGPSW